MKKVLIILIAGTILSCANNQYQNKSDKVKSDFDIVRFDSKKSAWEALEIKSYRFTAESFASSIPTIPITVTVLPDAEPELSYDSEKLTPAHMKEISKGKPFFPFSGFTIDELFSSIRERVIEYGEGIIQVRYNKNYHYPESFHVRDSLENKGGHSGLVITYFEVLEDSSGE
jgi:hypothetical protein